MDDNDRDNDDDDDVMIQDDEDLQLTCRGVGARVGRGGGGCGGARGGLHTLDGAPRPARLLLLVGGEPHAHVAVALLRLHLVLLEPDEVKDRIWRTNIFKDKPNLLFRPAIPFLDVQEVSLAESEGVAGELHLLAGGVHDVVDLALHVPGVLAAVVGVEAEAVPGPDHEVLLGLVRDRGAGVV